MSNGLDTIVVDEDPQICDQVSDVVKSFYTWGEVHPFSDYDQALEFSLNRDVGLGIFVLSSLFVGRIGFDFLDSLEPKFPLIYEDSIVTADYASDDLVNMCLAVGIEHIPRTVWQRQVDMVGDYPHSSVGIYIPDIVQRGTDGVG